MLLLLIICLSNHTHNFIVISVFARLLLLPLVRGTANIIVVHMNRLEFGCLQIHCSLEVEKEEKFCIIITSSGWSPFTQVNKQEGEEMNGICCPEVVKKESSCPQFSRITSSCQSHPCTTESKSNSDSFHPNDGR